MQFQRNRRSKSAKNDMDFNAGKHSQTEAQAGTTGT